MPTPLDDLPLAIIVKGIEFHRLQNSYTYCIASYSVYEPKPILIEDVIKAEK